MTDLLPEGDRPLLVTADPALLEGPVASDGGCGRGGRRRCASARGPSGVADRPVGARRPRSGGGAVRGRPAAPPGRRPRRCGRRRAGPAALARRRDPRRRAGGAAARGRAPAGRDDGCRRAQRRQRDGGRRRRRPGRSRRLGPRRRALPGSGAVRPPPAARRRRPVGRWRGPADGRRGRHGPALARLSPAWPAPLLRPWRCAALPAGRQRRVVGPRRSDGPAGVGRGVGPRCRGCARTTSSSSTCRGGRTRWPRRCSPARRRPLSSSPRRCVPPRPPRGPWPGCSPGPGARLVVRTGRGRSVEPELIASALGVPLAAVVSDEARLAADVDAGDPPGARPRSSLARISDALVAQVCGEPRGGRGG